MLVLESNYEQAFISLSQPIYAQPSAGSAFQTEDLPQVYSFFIMYPGLMAGAIIGTFYNFLLPFKPPQYVAPFRHIFFPRYGCKCRTGLEPLHENPTPSVPCLRFLRLESLWAESTSQSRYFQGNPYRFLGRFPTDKDSPFRYNGNRRFDILIIKGHNQRLHYGVVAGIPGKLFRW